MWASFVDMDKIVFKHINMKELSHNEEVASGIRFPFGENWSRFLISLDDSQIEKAVESLRDMLNIQTLKNKTFLDVGSGSGLFSLAARRLGATVFSFDFDPQSVACTEELKKRYYPEDNQWCIETGSVLDTDYLSKFIATDFVYCWGVLHHTGEMWEGLNNVFNLPKRDGGYLFIALYNNQGWISHYWTVVKRVYNKNTLGRWLMIALHSPYLLGLRFFVRLVSGRLRIERGMSMWHDMLDWLGGYPFEVATPEEIVKLSQNKNYETVKIRTNGKRMGCNEFIFVRKGTDELQECAR